MEDKKQHRQFFTDPKYRGDIETCARYEISHQKEQAAKPTKHFDPEDNQKKWYHPAIDRADIVALAVKAELNGRSGVDLDFDDPELSHEIIDTMAEIVRQGMGTHFYEGISTIELPAKEREWPESQPFTENPDGGFYTMGQVRKQLFDKLIDKALHHGQEPGNYTPTERCLRTVRSVIDVIDGGEGNRPGGEGLPLMQFILSPHPSFDESREEKNLPRYDNSIPLDEGLLPPSDYQTGMVKAFDRHFDNRFESNIKERSLRAARELFGG
jgi:hypothetical protein